MHINAPIKFPKDRGLLRVATTSVFLLLAAVTVNAQEVNGTPGSPSATTTIPGNQLPAPDPKFGGVIKDNALQSEPWWASRIVPPKQAPNIPAHHDR